MAAHLDGGRRRCRVPDRLGQSLAVTRHHPIFETAPLRLFHKLCSTRKFKYFSAKLKFYLLFPNPRLHCICICRFYRRQQLGQRQIPNWLGISFRPQLMNKDDLERKAPDEEVNNS